MDEIVQAVRRVTDIMGEISAASEEQSAGIEQVNRAVTHMDEVTQQNAALVEEAASASASLEDQTRKLKALLSEWRIEGGRAYIAEPAHKPAASKPAPAAQKRKAEKPVQREQREPRLAPTASAATVTQNARPALAAAAPKASDDNWESF